MRTLACLSDRPRAIRTDTWTRVISRWDTYDTLYLFLLKTAINISCVSYYWLLYCLSKTTKSPAWAISFLRTHETSSIIEIQEGITFNVSFSWDPMRIPFQITVGPRRHAFILAQAPLRDTIDDFWSAVWQKDVRVIVMLNEVTVSFVFFCYSNRRMISPKLPRSQDKFSQPFSRWYVEE